MSKKEKKPANDLIYRLQEMYDSMQESLDNIEKVKAQQEGLIEIVENSDKYDDYKDFVKELKAQIEEMDKQKEKLSNRTLLLRDILFGLDQNIITARSAVNNLLIVLNVFGEQ